MGIPREEAEGFCYEVKMKFRENQVAAGHYDKADMLEDLTEFLKRFDVEVSE